MTTIEDVAEILAFFIEVFCEYASYIPFAVLTFWATMRLLFGWFSFGYYYSEIGIVECLLALYILWAVGSHLLKQSGER